MEHDYHLCKAGGYQPGPRAKCADCNRPVVAVDDAVPLGMMEFRYADGTRKRVFTNFP